MPPSDINKVRQYLLSRYMFVDDDWLEECVEHFSTNIECPGANIEKLVEEQWLLNNLNGICPGSLPANVKNHQKITLTGKFVVQINSVIDVGTPAFQQYLKLKKVNLENIEATTNREEKISSHRMLKLELTDGVQDISAIEYTPMRNLSCDLRPGFKILIKGTGSKCINYYILRFLWRLPSAGQPQTLKVTLFTPWHDISQRGFFPISDTEPALIKIVIATGRLVRYFSDNYLSPVVCRRGMLLLTENSIELLGGEAQELFETNCLAGLLNTKFAMHGADYITANQMRNFQISTPNPAPQIYPASNHVSEEISETTHIPTRQPTDFTDDDIDIDQLAELEAQFTDNPGKRSLNSDDSNPEKKVKIDSNKPEDYPDDDDLLFEDTDYMREIEAQIDAQEKEVLLTTFNPGPVHVSSDPFIYIKQFKEMRENEKVGKCFKVKGQIMTLLSKLSVSKDEWSLKCTIVDGTGRLDVDFTSDVLSKLVGITPQEMIAMKKQIGVSTTKSELEVKLQAALKNARDKLQVMYCIIEITMFDTPKITDYKPYESIHVEQLKKRVPNGTL